MRTILISAVILVALPSLFGCAAKTTLPIASNVCLQLVGLESPGAPFVRRKVASYLTEAGFQPAEADCDVTAIYTNFNSAEWEILERRVFGTKSTSAWRAEGTLALQQGNILIEDQPIDLRDEPTQLELFESLASEIVEVLSEYYLPAVQQ